MGGSDNQCRQRVCGKRAHCWIVGQDFAGSQKYLHLLFGQVRLSEYRLRFTVSHSVGQLGVETAVAVEHDLRAGNELVRTRAEMVFADLEDNVIRAR